MARGSLFLCEQKILSLVGVANLLVHREWVLGALQEYELRLLRYALRLLGDEG